jgi:hypothetical protein
MKKTSKTGKFVPGTYDLRVKRTRSGLGLVTYAPIKKGACIIEYVGKVLNQTRRGG